MNVLKYIDQIYNVLLLKRKHVKWGDRLSINGRILVRGHGNLSLGNDVRINSNIFFNPIGGDGQTMFLLKDSSQIIIGNNVGISNSAIVSYISIIIQDNVLIGGGCKIYDTDFHSIGYEARVNNGDSEIKSIPVLIQKGAFIGAHSIILKGVTIGEKSVIGAGSVVTRSVPAGEVWAGNPAHFVRKVGD